MAAKALPMSIQIDGHTFQGTDIEMDEQVKIILETNDMVYRRYRDDRGRIVDMLVVFSADNRKGTHPPEVCLKGANTEIDAKRVVNMDLPGMGTMPMRELETTTGRIKAWHLYVYKCGDAYTYSFFKQQLVVFLNGLLQRNAAGALIHLTVPVMSAGPDAKAEARSLEYDAARVLLPQIDRKLP
jgi:EpsI family protein